MRVKEVSSDYDKKGNFEEQLNNEILKLEESNNKIIDIKYSHYVYGDTDDIYSNAYALILYKALEMKK